MDSSLGTAEEIRVLPGQLTEPSSTHDLLECPQQLLLRLRGHLGV